MRVEGKIKMQHVFWCKLVACCLRHKLSEPPPTLRALWDQDTSTEVPSLASYPGLLTPVFVACRGRPGKTESHAMTYLDMWRSGTFLEKQQVSALPITNTDCRTTERLTSDSLGNVSWIQEAALQLYRRIVSLVQVHHCTWLSFTRPSPALVLQATNAGVRRTGYEDNPTLFHYCTHVVYHCPIF